MKPNYYSIIPAKVRYDKDLSPNAKLLYGEITSLSNQQGYCWATNNYFAKLYGVSKITISRLIKSLISKGYLVSKLEYIEGTKCIKERRLYLVDLYTAPINKIDDISNQKNWQSIDIKDIRPINNIVKDNNTSVNNKKINTLNTYKKNEISKLKEFAELYQKNIGVINGVISEELIAISQEIEVELFKEAIRIASDRSKCNFGYIRGILNQWKKNNITTFKDLKRSMMKNQQAINKQSEVEIDAVSKFKNKGYERSAQEEAKDLLKQKGKRFRDYL